MLSQLIALTPLFHSPEHNLVRIERIDSIEGGKSNNVQFIAGGPFQGIVINKPMPDHEKYPTQYPCSFSVWISSDGGKTLKQEKRTFRFCFYSNVPLAHRAASSNRFIRHLFDGTFPKNYANFFKLLLRLMQTDDYPQIRAIEVEMKFAVGEEQMPMPSAKQLVNDGEVENVSSGLVREVLERAFPNSVLEEALAENLRCSLDEIRSFLDGLEKDGIVVRVPNQPGEWIRKAYEPNLHSHVVSTKSKPKIAIITCLFPEKLCVDTIMQNSSTEHHYSKMGDSNIYTEGEIAGHRIVATKLAMIGTDREAATSAGSITTRLLGKYQNIEHVIIVGISGGQAHMTDPEMHVRLGDVVVSHGGQDEATGSKIGAYVYAYNIESKQNTGDIQFEVRDWTPKENTLGRQMREIKDVAGFLRSWHANSASLVGRLNDKHRDQQMDFSRPPPSADGILQLSNSGNMVVFAHPNESRTTPMYHLGPVGSMVIFCMKSTSEEEQNQPHRHQPPPGVPSTPLKPTNRRGILTSNNSKNEDDKNEGQNGEEENKPNGVAADHADPQSPSSPPPSTMDSDGADGVEKVSTAVEEEGNNNANDAAANSTARINERLREKFRASYHLRAFDAGFDSVIAAIVGSQVHSWVLVRGISDYQQGISKQGKQWQNYAAANAVALVETLLQTLPNPDSAGQQQQ